MPRNPNRSSSNSFNIAEELDELTFDFTKFVKGAKGTIPEPSSEQVRAFHSALRHITAPAREMFERAKKMDASEEEVTMAALDALGDEADDAAKELMDGACDAAAALCSNRPSSEQIRQLPWRGQKAFIGWLSGQFLNPES